MPTQTAVPAKLVKTKQSSDGELFAISIPRSFLQVIAVDRGPLPVAFVIVYLASRACAAMRHVVSVGGCWSDDCLFFPVA